jgi:hypothetical protein
MSLSSCEFMKIGAVKAVLDWWSKWNVVHILYIFLFWIQFGTGDVHKNLLFYCEFRENGPREAVVYLMA